MFQFALPEHATLDPRVEKSLSSWVQDSFQTLLYPGALILSFLSGRCPGHAQAVGSMELSPPPLTGDHNQLLPRFLLHLQSTTQLFKANTKSGMVYFNMPGCNLKLEIKIQPNKFPLVG